ncbi:MAG: threonine synthase [Planctomycetes bacterium]|nr:threonine synthase [Planctomycetota bacterium]MBI3834205.1 threonine synthase [Planctomycetota bacterium]
MASFVTHLEAAIDGTRLPHDQIQTLHQGRPLWVRYDLNAIREAITPGMIAWRPPTMWRYRELLPVPGDVEPVSIGESITPLLPAPQLAARFGLSHFWIKDESRLPTGSFKSRGLAMAVNMARQFGITRLAIPSAGNAGGAMAAYAARAGMEAYVFMPRDTPIVNQVECVLAGAKTFLVNGLITDCGQIVRAGADTMNWFDCSTLKEPYRIEGKKTMGLELAEQFEYSLPDFIVYPTGGGTGLIGMWKAFQELRALGWLKSDTMPQMISVQSDGCAPIARAFDAGERFAAPWVNAHTCASGLRVPAAVGDFMILDAIRESGGFALAVPEQRIASTMREASRLDGIALCPESAACVLAIEFLRADGRLAPNDRVVLFNTGSAAKYIETVPLNLQVLHDPKNVDFSALAR